MELMGDCRALVRLPALLPLERRVSLASSWRLWYCKGRIPSANGPSSFKDSQGPSNS